MEKLKRLFHLKKYLLLFFLLLTVFLHTYSSVERKYSTIDNILQNSKKIIGKVVDENGEPLIGVTIIIKGTTQGIVTDIDGNYTINVPSSASLIFSYVGMKTKEVPVNELSILNVVLESASIGLQEVVAVGYGKQKKASVVGAISQASGEEVVRSSKGMVDLRQSLAGNLPGVSSLTSTNEPGGSGTGGTNTRIFVRGLNTWNGGQALILVDGVERPIENLDPNEVETVSVLKDASATAVYGVKGANGVILITTKRGRLGKPELSFGYYLTGNIASKLPEKVDSYNSVMARNEAIEREVVLNEPSWGDYIPYQIAKRYREYDLNPDYRIIYPDVDWKKALLKDIGFSHRANFNVRGGSKYVKYYGSLAYLRENDLYRKYDNHKGYQPDYNFDRFNFRSNFDFSLTPTTNVKLDLTGFYSKKNTSYWSGTSGIMAAVYTMAPNLFIPQYPDGRFGYNYRFQENPIASLANMGISYIRRASIMGDVGIEQGLDFVAKGLKASASFSFDNNFISTQALTENAGSIRPDNAYANVPLAIIDPLKYIGPEQDPSEYTTYEPIQGRNGFDWTLIPWSMGSEYLHADVYRRIQYQTQLDYQRKFGLHSISAMGVFKREEYASKSEFKYYREDWVFRSTYDYDSRYLFEINGAYNGSEQFGPGYRFDFFPSYAIGWNVANEKFFNVNSINNLKIRFSTGLVGDDKVSSNRWLYDSQWATNTTRVNFGQNINNSTLSPYPWTKESVIGNPNIHWEKARKNDLGIEIGFLENIVSISYDYFTEKRSNILLDGSLRSMPSYFGVAPPSVNIGIVKSMGHELQIQFNKRTNYGLHYWINSFLTHTQNEVKAKDDPALYPGYQKEIGYPVGQMKAYRRAGFLNSWDDIYAGIPYEIADQLKLPGSYNIIDFNGDGIIKSDDVIPWGYPIVPQNTLSLTLGADYNKIAVSVQFYGVSNVTRSVGLSAFYKNTDLLYKERSNYWSKDNLDAHNDLPRWKVAGGQNVGDLFYYDASYIRLKTLEISYDADQKWIKNKGINSLRLFINGNNLFFWSRMPDDREENATGAYPTLKRFNFGIEMNF